MEATFATSIHIHNVRHLSDIAIPLSNDTRKNLLLTGKNGSGKTSVLRALVLHLKHISNTNHASQETCERQLAYYKAQLEKQDDSEKGRREKLDAKKQIDYWNNQLKMWTEGVTLDYTSLALLQEKYQKGQFVLAFFGDTRIIRVDTSNNIEKIELKPAYSIDDTPSKQLAKYLVNLKATQAFANAEGNIERANQIKVWFDNFEKILRNIYDDDSLTLEFNIENYHFSIRVPNREPFEFNTMSMGYAAIFDIIGDLVIRMEAQKNYNLEGIVLIDEIETHLHVELQRKILPILTELFPNLQFIITTHSPFILNSASNSVVYDLEKHTLVENGLTNLPYDGIVEGYFESDKLSEELRNKFNLYAQLVKKDNLTDAEYAKIAELEQYLDEVPDFLALDFATEYSRLKLEFDQ